MGKLNDYIARLEAVTVESQERDILEIIKSQETIITNLNTDQLFEGERSDGTILPDYSPVSVEAYGKPAGPIRLYDEGDFYRGFFIETDNFPVMFGSRDSKSEMLKNEFGKNIFGLTTENLIELNQSYLRTRVQAYYSRLLSVR